MNLSFGKDSLRARLQLALSIFAALSIGVCVLLQWRLALELLIAASTAEFVPSYTLAKTKEYVLIHTLWMQMPFFLVSLVCVSLLERGKAFRRALSRSLIFLSIAGAAAAASAYFVGSSDLLYYISYGRQVSHLGQNPYYDILDANLLDPIISHIPRHFVSFPACYGPTALTLFAFINRIVPQSIASLVIAFKLIWLAGFCVLFFCTSRLLTKFRHPFAGTALMALCCNPVTWWLLLGDAHLELWILLCLVLMLNELFDRRFMLAGVFLAAAVTMKISLAPCAPLALVYIARSSDDRKESIRSAARFLSGFFVYSIIAYGFYRGSEIRSLALVLEKGPRFYNVIAQLARDALIALSRLELGIAAPTKNSPYVDQISMICFASGYLMLMLSFARQKKASIQSLAVHMGMALIWLILTSVYVQPWYYSWPFFLFIVGMPNRAALTVMAIAYGTVEIFSVATRPQAVAPISMIALVSLGLYFCLRYLQTVVSEKRS